MILRFPNGGMHCLCPTIFPWKRRDGGKENCFPCFYGQPREEGGEGGASSSIFATLLGCSGEEGDSPVAKGESEKGGLVGGEIAWRYTSLPPRFLFLGWLCLPRLLGWFEVRSRKVSNKQLLSGVEPSPPPLSRGRAFVRYGGGGLLMGS